VGVDLKELIPQIARKQISDLRELAGKIIALDAYNALYQFLSAIRQPDGTPLMDSRGRVTSHLSGLFYRTITLVEYGIKPVYVFDGVPPEIKAAEIEKRKAMREEAERKYKEALAAGRIEEARRYAQATSKLTNEMVDDAKKLLTAMGIPWIQAPSEGEAQAACITRKGDAWATSSQDYDSLLFCAPRLVRNLTIHGRRKLPGKDIYIELKPEVVELDKILKTLGITREQLVDIAILIGTDYNPDGVKGVGPKTALRIIKAYGNLEKALKALPKASFPVDPLKIKDIFLNPPCDYSYKLEWHEPDEKSIMEVLVEEHDFSKDRVTNAVQRLRRAYREHIKGAMTSLDKWFKRKR